MTKPGIECEFVGFKVPNKFLVGYGLDYAQKYRSLTFIGVRPITPLNPFMLLYAESSEQPLWCARARMTEAWCMQVLAPWVYAKLDPKLDGSVCKGHPADSDGLPQH